MSSYSRRAIACWLCSSRSVCSALARSLSRWRTANSYARGSISRSTSPAATMPPGMSDGLTRSTCPPTWAWSCTSSAGWTVPRASMTTCVSETVRGVTSTSLACRCGALCGAFGPVRLMPAAMSSPIPTMISGSQRIFRTFFMISLTVMPSRTVPSLARQASRDSSFRPVRGTGRCDSR